MNARPLVHIYGATGVSKKTLITFERRFFPPLDDFPLTLGTLLSVEQTPPTFEKCIRGLSGHFGRFESDQGVY